MFHGKETKVPEGVPVAEADDVHCPSGRVVEIARPRLMLSRSMTEKLDESAKATKAAKMLQAAARHKQKGGPPVHVPV